MKDKFKIGFIDEDPLQVKKYQRELREEFDVIGYKIDDGLTIDDLLSQVYASEIDLLMVDFLMKDSGIVTYNGDEVVRRYEKIKPRFPMIIFTNEENQAFPVVDNPNIIYKKEDVLNKPETFFEILRKNIHLYTDYIEEKKTLIAALMAKEALTAKEKHQLSEAQFELRNLDKWAVEAPSQLLEERNVDKLSKTTREAEEFLAKMIKQLKDGPTER